MSAFWMALRLTSIAFASALLLHGSVRLLAGPQPWRSTFRLLFPGLLALLALGTWIPDSGNTHLLFIGARLLAAMALVGLAYGISFARVCGAWIIAIALAGGFIVPAIFVKAVYEGVTKATAARTARRTLASPDASAAILLQEQALKALRDHRYKDAERTLRQALQLRLVAGERDSDLAVTYYTMGDLYYQQHDWAQAETFYRQALSVAQEAFPEKSSQLANYYNALGCALYSRKRPAEAEVLHLKALDLLESEKKKQPDTYRLFLRNYAKDLRDLSREREALDAEKRAARIAGGQ